MNDNGAAIRERILAALGPDPFDLLLEAGRSMPNEFLEAAPEEFFEYLRCRLRFTQAELAGKAGLAQSVVSELEGGKNARLSTWTRVYGAMGFKLILLPYSPRTSKELERLSEEGRPANHWRSQRVKPRRRRMIAAGGASGAAPGEAPGGAPGEASGGAPGGA